MLGLADLVFDVLTLKIQGVSVLSDTTENLLVDDVIVVDGVVIVVDDAVVAVEVIFLSTVSSSELESYLSFFRMLRNLAQGSLRFITKTINAFQTQKISAN